MTPATSIVPRTRTAPAAWVYAADTTYPLLHSKCTPMRWLRPVEIATLRPRFVPGVPSPESILSVPAWGACYLHERAQFGTLYGNSAWELAWGLQEHFIRYGPRPKDPWRGLDALRLVDADSESSGVELWLDGAPRGADWTRYRRMRLRDRLAELGWSA